MPKISEQRRAERQAQILEAAWRCFYREGVQATTMEHIIEESGLSASAMYRYFAGKEDIIVAAITTSLEGLAALLEGTLRSAENLDPATALQRLTAEIETFSDRPSYQLTTIAVHGWSEALRNDRLRVLLGGYYRAFRGRLTELVRAWQARGQVQAETQAEDIAQLLLSVLLGFVAQTAILGDASPRAHARGLEGF